MPVSPVGSSPFAPCGAAVTPGGTVYVSGEVEPYVASNPADLDFLVGGWQQDRWSDGGRKRQLVGGEHRRRRHLGGYENSGD